MCTYVKNLFFSKSSALKMADLKVILEKKNKNDYKHDLLDAITGIFLWIAALYHCIIICVCSSKHFFQIFQYSSEKLLNQ